MAAPTIVTLRAGVAFTPAAAASFVRCEADLGRRIDVNSSYRDYNLQMSMYNAWRRYVNSGYKPSLKPPHSLAVHPDASAHSKGIGLDSDDWTRPGFNAFMADHGWIRTAASDPTERHHFEYQTARDNHRTRPAGGTGTVLEPEPEKEDDDVLQRIRNTDNGTIAIGNPASGAWWELPGPEYEKLIDGWGFWDRTKDLNVPTNIYNMLKGIASTGRDNNTAEQIATAVWAKDILPGAAASTFLRNTANEQEAIKRHAELVAKVAAIKPDAAGAPADLTAVEAAFTALRESIAGVPAAVRADLKANL